MKPAVFKYIAVESTKDAISVLIEHGDEAKVLAGGQSLIPMMNMRLARPGVLVDINRIAGLDSIAGGAGLEIGALARHSAVLRSPEVQAFAPIMSRALTHVGHVGIRNRGTIGGSIAHADSAAEMPTVLLALGGSVVAEGPRGERVIAADDLFVTNFTTRLDDEEILTRVLVPSPSQDSRSSFHEVARRHGDFALVMAAATADVRGGVIHSPRIVIGSVADRPIRATAAEQYLEGQTLGDPDVIHAAALLVVEDINPPNDVHASGDYRKEVAQALVHRALTDMATQGA